MCNRYNALLSISTEHFLVEGIAVMEKGLSDQTTDHTISPECIGLV